MINIREVNAKTQTNTLLLRQLHDETFGDEAEVPDFSEGWWWLAFDKKIPIGFGWLAPSHRYNDFAYLGRCGVIPLYRGKGIQRKLIQIRERKAKKNGYNGCVTDTTRNIPSANNLIRAGYLLYTPSTLYGFSDTLYWRKRFE